MLSIISTPIGNVKDISMRAVEALENVEILLCEDTRVTGNLLRILAIKNKPKLVSFYDEVEEQKIPQVIEWLQENREIGLVTDAGTPLVSDPGWRLVKRCYEVGLQITALPGPSAIINALVLSGLTTDRFIFLGFLPKKDGSRKALLEKFKDSSMTCVAYESPHRLEVLIDDLERFWGVEVEIAVCREMTKKFEEIIKGKPVFVREKIAASVDRGECVVVWK